MQTNQYPFQATELTVLDRFDVDQQDTVAFTWQTKKYDLPTLVDSMVVLFPNLTENIYTANGSLPTGVTRTFDLDTGELNLLNGNLNVGGTNITGGIFRTEITGSPAGILVIANSGTAGQFSGDYAMLLSSGNVGLLASAPRNIIRDDAGVVPPADDSCVLELISTERGVLMPRMTETERDTNIPTPSDYLEQTNTNKHRKEFYHPLNGWTPVGEQIFTTKPGVVEQPTGFSHDLGYLRVIRPVGGTAEIVNFNKETLRKKLDTPVVKYVDQVNGIDTNTGDSWAQAYRTIDKLRTVSFDRAYTAGNMNYSSLNNPMFTTENEIISVGGTSTFCFGFVGTERTWASIGSGTFSNSITAAVTVILDTSKFDSDGDYFRLTPLTSLVDVQANPDSFWKDSGTNTLYVHYADGLTPSRNSAVMAISQITHTNGHNNYRENIDFILGTSTNNTTATASTINHINCSYLFNTITNGLTIRGNTISYLEKCRAGKNFLDGFNYHKASTYNPIPIEYRCIGVKNGENNTTSINNGSTTHEEVKILRVGCIYFDNEGPNVHDVNSALSWNVDCVAYDSAAVTPTSKSNFALGAAAAETCEMWLDGCTTHGEGTTFGAEDRTGLDGINVRNTFLGNIEPGTTLTDY